ncbi:MAG: CoA transferase, partial [Deltaproteobacteria bacterium]|nr:CoA transferase [Deltaproteobacteria bacterium]
MRGPLEKLRVLERATGIAGPYAGRLLAMLGATVVKCEPTQGDPVRRQPVDSVPVSADAPGSLHVHLNAGKRLVTRDRLPLDRALAWADVVIDSAVARELRGTPLDPDTLAAGVDAPLLVTTSAWGFEADDAGSPCDELLVQAAAGVMCTTGDPEGPPLRLPGFQAQYLAGGYVAAAALAALRGPGWRHVDVPWVHAIASGVEASWARSLQAGLRDPPGGAHQADVFPSGALACADGFVVPGTVRPADWVAQCRVYGMPELMEDERFRSRGRRRRNCEELWSELEPWYAARTRSEIFEAALAGNWALGMVLAGRDLLDDPHVASRGYLGTVELPKGATARAPVRPWKAPDTGEAVARLAEPGEDDGWFAREARPRAPAEAPARGALAELRVLELTQAWAGPFAGRLLAALGADVVKVESQRRPDGWRGPSAFGDMAPHAGRDPKELSVEISTAYNGLNRSKRHCSIDLTLDAGRHAFLDLVRAADVVIANLTARVLPNLRLTFDDLSAVNPRIILVNMPALGATGPFRDAVGYGTIVEGMGGLGSLFGPPEAGARISQTYYP